MASLSSSLVIESVAHGRNKEPERYGDHEEGNGGGRPETDSQLAVLKKGPRHSEEESRRSRPPRVAAP